MLPSSWLAARNSRDRQGRLPAVAWKITQDATHSTYSWAPMQSWNRNWTDSELYAKYGLTDDEVSFVESMIRPMELSDG